MADPGLLPATDKGAPNVRVALAEEGPQPTAGGKHRKLIPLPPRT